MAPAPTIKDLRDEVRQVQLRHPNLSEDNAFCFWFVHAYLTEDEEDASRSLLGGSGDVGLDAMHIDAEARRVYVVQAKYRTRSGVAREAPNEVLALGTVGEDLLGDKASFDARTARANPRVQERLHEARRRVTRDEYRLCVIFVTTGAVAPRLEDAIQGRARDRFDCRILQRQDVLQLLADYVDGAAPPVPLLDLPVDGDSFLRRFDSTLGIESWVFSMAAADVARLYNEAGVRLFARNIRGFLGWKTNVNTGMESTLRQEPDHFWYYNNGITVVCDSAQDTGKGGQRRLRVAHAQIINGQQTTRMIARAGGRVASVLVRVIAIARTADGGAYERLVGRIVEATNWQNAMKPSDLMSNDVEQVRLERELRKRSYAYLRKRSSKGEARRLIRFKPVAFIKKEELAQYVGSCVLDPLEVRAGKERLFETDLYPKVFAHFPINLYLTMYWLGRAVGYSSRARASRGYAKWLVLHFLWEQLSEVFRSALKRDLFVRAWEREWFRGGKVFASLSSALNRIFQTADLFYKRYRGSGSEALDHSTFFKRRGLHDRFAEFWRTGRHKSRKAVEAAVRRFWVALREYEEA